MSAAYLLLEDGTRFDGESRRARTGRTALGEVVFNTSMSGYQEAVTDPSYAGQIIVFTYPLIGNYGVARGAHGVRPHPRARGDHARGRRPRGRRRAPRAAGSPGCADCGIPALTGVDTRALVRHIRDKGAMRGGVFPAPSCPRPRRASSVMAEPSMAGRDLAREVTPAEPRDPRPRRPGPAGGRHRHRHQGLDRAQPARARRAARAAPLHGDAPRSCSRASPTPSSSPTAPATRRRSTTSSRPCAGVVGQGAGLGHLPRPPAALPRGRPRDLQAARSATAAPTTRSRTSRPGRIDITSQNHGFAVLGPGGERTIDGDEPVRWETDFGAAELSAAEPLRPHGRGAGAARRPGSTVQYHPEAGPGPHDALHLFDRFLDRLAVRLMPRRDDISKILVIGSGPIVIGQAAEFDYSGAQACKVLLEEGYEVVLVNSNPATIMTDPEFATATYIEPLLPGLGGAR